MAQPHQGEQPWSDGLSNGAVSISGLVAPGLVPPDPRDPTLGQLQRERRSTVILAILLTLSCRSGGGQRVMSRDHPHRPV
jgi:hypothetical protein